MHVYVCILLRQTIRIPEQKTEDKDDSDMRRIIYHLFIDSYEIDSS